VSENRLRIGDVARLAGVSRRTVDFYTRMGILRPAERSQGNYRLYDPDSVDRIRLVRRLEGQGVPLAEIATALDGRETGPQDVAASLELLDREIHALRKAVKAMPAVGGLVPTGALHTLTDRLRALIETAMEITGGGVPPGL
jgi:MerR family transcriptional regulator, copper efflux regulator